MKPDTKPEPDQQRIAHANAHVCPVHHVAYPQGTSCPQCAADSSLGEPTRHSDRCECAAKHTPGPWSLHDAVSGIEICVANGSPVDSRHKNKQWICTLNHKCDWVSREEVEANAHLIAAAPELLLMLESIAANMPPLPTEDGKHWPWLTTVNLTTVQCEAVRAAIAKAKGGAQ